MQGEHSPLSIDKRFIMLGGSSGFYSYGIYQHQEDMPAFNLNETRIAFMLRKDKFEYLAVTNDRQRRLPLPEDRVPPRGKELAYPEAVLLVDPLEPEFKGEMFVSTHYGGEDLVIKFGEGEKWKKVFGPVFIYLNSCAVDKNDAAVSLWYDAKEQMEKEVGEWPYSFPASEDFPHADQRGSISGRLLAQDWYIYEGNIAAKGAYVGLAPPGKDGSFQVEAKGYQFWTNADEEGSFCITNIRPGAYNIYAWIPGFIGDFRCDKDIVVTAGSKIDVGDLVYVPPRNGPTLWEIGIPDRSAGEFFVPDPNPMYINKLYINLPNDRFRQYGLWERYADLYPDDDLVYTVGTSDYQKDWFYAQVTRKIGENAYKGTTWQIKFSLDRVREGNHTLRIALASATFSILEVRINRQDANPPEFSSGLIGSDNTIARHGLHGLYWLFNVEIPSSQLIQGENTIYLTQARSASAVHGIMYDYIRLEDPPLDRYSSSQIKG
ncbi:UNVERIFIED_CONTAM: putative rhamnogalacturonate lyase A [Sesamum radiatum]|uniref:Rhamnogalacturonate lyase A n=1 Tax=Sesamum radiatum TaxID=300843 RepID=A0AAW2Q212_SESRA